MFRVLLWSFILLLTSIPLNPIVAEPAAQHVVIISVDGFRPDFYRDASWPAPTIQSMAEEGAHAERVRSVFPSVTYPSHTTIMTGVLPARHGIYYNRPFEKDGQTWHRLRMGFFAGESDARHVMEALRAEFPQAWITKASPGEAEVALQAAIPEAASPREAPGPGQFPLLLFGLGEIIFEGG